MYRRVDYELFTYSALSHLNPLAVLIHLFIVTVTVCFELLPDRQK